MLRRRLAQSWRALRTGCAFAVFGAGSIAIAFVVLPVIERVSSPAASPRRVRRVIRVCFRAFVWLMTALGLIRVRRADRERLRAGGPRVIVANHPTLIDVVLLVAAVPDLVCVVKSAAWGNVFMRGVVRRAGYVPNDAGGVLVPTCVAELRAGRTLLFFPEGTRSPGDRLGRFHRGAARIALAAGCDIVPVVVHCEPPTLKRGQPWFDVPDRVVHFTLDVKSPLSPRAYAGGARPAARAARLLADDLRTLFERELGYAS